MSQFIPQTFFDFIGLLGVAIAVLAFAILQAGLIRGQSYTYAGLNLLSAVLVLISLTASFNLSSSIKQVIWIGISLFGIIRLFVLNRYLSFSEEEQEILSKALPELGKASSRKFFKCGEWVDLTAGVVLISENKPVEYVTYLTQGAFNISLNDAHIATTRPGSFVGELSWQNNSKASATVTSAKPCRVFRIKSETLRQQTAADTDLKHALELSFSEDTKNKLQAANKRLANELS